MTWNSRNPGDSLSNWTRNVAMGVDETASQVPWEMAAVFWPHKGRALLLVTG